MKQGIWSLLIGLACLFASCKVIQPAGPANSPWQNDWLLIHVNEWMDGEYSGQKSILLGLDPAEVGGYSASLFCSQTGLSRQDFKYGVSQAIVGLPNRKKSLAVSSMPDSSGTGFRFHLSHSSFWLDFKPALGSITDEVKLRLKLSAQKWPAAHPWFQGCRLWMVDAKEVGPGSRKDARMEVSILGIPSIASLLALGQGGEVVWIFTNLGKQPGGMLMRHEAGQLFPIAGTGSLSPSSSTSPAKAKFWHSENSNVTYPVEFELSTGLIVSAFNLDQELRLGRRSFWMGAVHLKDAEERDSAMVGNMVIFRPPR